ncbi:MAG: hypothetical protein SH821_03850 [Phototrophicales bacterium]|nr:hypothetical protein [Phototrophicales bacterium]
MKINPKNGHITLTEVGNKIITPNMPSARYMALGFSLNKPDHPATSGQIRQKTLPPITVQFGDGKLNAIFMPVVSHGGDEIYLNQAYRYLAQMGVDVQRYSWGEVNIDELVATGDMWIEIQYYQP